MECKVVLADRNEALKHNTCKKVAQLTKVIYNMGTENREREDDMNNIRQDYEYMIETIVDDFQEKAEDIVKDLVSYRKGCVDNSCRIWGSKYKQTKVDFANLIKTQQGRFNTLIESGREMSKSLKESQANAMKAAALMIESSSAVEKDLKAKTRPKSQARSDVKSNVKPILEKIELLEKESQARIAQMKVEQTKAITENRNGINLFLKKELLDRKDSFMKSRNELEVIYNELGKLKQLANAIISERNKSMKIKTDTKKEIISNTKQECLSIKKKMKELNNQEKLDSKTRVYEVSEMKRQQQRINNSRKIQIDEINRQIKDQKHKRHQKAATFANDMKKYENASLIQAKNLIAEFEKEAKMKKAEHKDYVTVFKECNEDIEQVKTTAQQMIDDSLEHMHNRALAFGMKLEKQNENGEVRTSEDIANFMRRANDRVQILESALDVQTKSLKKSRKHERKANKKLAKTLNTIKERHNEELIEARSKYESEMKRVEEHNNTRLSEKKNEIENSINRKKGDKKKQLTDLQTNFTSDLNKLKSQIETQNNAKLEQFKSDSLNSSPNKKLIEDHERKLSQSNAKLQYAINQIQVAKTNNDKAIENLENEIVAKEKRKRQLERAKKAQRQSIDEEFEMKIQVEQVKLRNTIENISQLYDKDENQRGCDIIEAIRKVKEAKNRKDDLFQKKTREISDMKEAFSQKAQGIQARINDFNNNTKENSLKQNYETLQNDWQNRLESYEHETESRLQDIQERIKINNNDFSRQIEETNKLLEVEEQKFGSVKHELESKRNEIEEEEEKRITLIDEEYEKQKQRTAVNHERMIEKMKNRIESAQKLYEEVNQKNEEEKQVINNEFDAKLVQVKNVNSSEITKISEKFQKQNDKFINKINKLTDKQSSIEMQVNDPPTRDVDLDRIQETRERIQQLDQQIVASFDEHYSWITHAPENVEVSSDDENKPPPMSSRMSRKTTSRNSKRGQTPLTSRLYAQTMVIDQKLHGRPMLITPTRYA